MHLALHQAFSGEAESASVPALNDALQINTVLTRYGVASRCTWEPTSWQKHPSHPSDPRMSVHSVGWCKLHRHDWFYIELNVEIEGGELVRAPAPSGSQKLFHGTEFGSVLKIVRARQGFIVGPGTHGVHGKSWSGLWCVPSLPDAVTRSDPERYKYQGDFTRFCCPMVIELETASVIKTVPQTCKHCIPGQHGQQLHGVIFRRVHFNKRFCVNYMRLESPMIRRRLAEDSFHCRRCACRICGAVSLPEDVDDWNRWEKSNGRQWYLPECLERVKTGVGWL